MSKKSIQVYGDKFILEDGAGVFITGIDPDQVVNEMYAGDVLDALDEGTIFDYVHGVGEFYGRHDD